MFCLPHRQALRDNLLGKLDSTFLGWHGKDGASVTSSQQALLHHILNLTGKIHESQRVCDCRTRLRKNPGKTLLGQSLRLKKLLVALCLFNGRQVCTLQVFNEGKLKHLVIIDFTNNCRNLLESRQLASLVATLACNNLELVALLANKNWLKHTILLYRVS